MKFEFSAGGIVYKNQKDKILILVAQHSQHHGWVFPKGLIDKKPAITETQKKTETQKFSASDKFSDSVVAGETKEEAALREVREETGVYAKIVRALPPVTYWYKFENEKIKKTVYYFLMEYASGDTKYHDFEMENVEWLPINEAQDRLTYKSDKEVWKKALAVIPNLF